MAMLREDMWCHELEIGYGLQEAPSYFFEGHNRYPGDVAALEAGDHLGIRHIVRSTSKME